MGLVSSDGTDIDGGESMKDKIVSVRFSEADYADLERRAKQQGITVSELIRRSVMPKMDVLVWRPDRGTYTVGAPSTTSIIWDVR